MATERGGAVENGLALAAWAFLFWLLLTWTATAEQLLFGAGLAAVTAILIAPLGKVVGPWRLGPRRLRALAALVARSAVEIVRANASLTRRIWFSPHPPSGMVIVPTRATTDGEIAATGLITSLIVDNQIIDLDRSSSELQYHAVAVPEGSPEDRAEGINAPTERLVGRFRQEE
jgi:multicomponent Na+:H+ antiporter subunit E